METKESLALKYRPKKLSALIGQEHITKQLEGMLAGGQIAQTIMFVGQGGSGKTSVARMLARYANCQNLDLEKMKVCETCVSCIRKTNHPDVHELNMAESRGIDDIRDLINRANYKPQTNLRFFILDECLDGGTLIATRSGHQRLRDLNEGDEVRTPKGYARIKKKWTTTKEAFQYKTKDGRSLIASANHLVPTFTGTRTCSIKPIDECTNLINYTRPTSKKRRSKVYRHLAELVGWFIADGTMTDYTARFSFKKVEKVVALESCLTACGLHSWSKLINQRGDTQIDFPEHTLVYQLLAQLGFTSGKKATTVTIPNEYFHSCSEEILRGIYNGDGYVTNKVGFDTASKVLRRQISRMLGSLGITHSLPKPILRGNAKHNTRYRINLTPRGNRIFEKIVGFSVESKATKLKDVNERVKERKYTYEDRAFTIPVIAKKSMGHRELIDIELDDEDKLFIANGYVVHNCHQVTPQAIQALLKPLEEPPPQTVWILCTTNPEKFPNTIIQRCRIFEMEPLTTENCVSLLQRVCKREEFDFPIEHMETLASLTKCQPRSALKALEGVMEYCKRETLKRGDLGKLLPQIISTIVPVPPYEIAATWLNSVYKGKFSDAILAMEKVTEYDYFLRTLIENHRYVMYKQFGSKTESITRIDATQIMKSLEAKNCAFKTSNDVMAKILSQMIIIYSKLKDYTVDAKSLILVLTTRCVIIVKRGMEDE